MKNKIFSGQLDDEEVKLIFRRHPVVMRKGLIAIMIGMLAGGLVGMYLSRNTISVGDLWKSFFLPIIAGTAVGAIGFLYHWIGWYYSLCIVTDQRFIQINQTGIFKKRSVNDINLQRILSVNYAMSGMLESLLGFGTIIIQTMAGDFVIEKVPKPAKQQSLIVKIIKESGVELRDGEE